MREGRAPTSGAAASAAWSAASASGARAAAARHSAALPAVSSAARAGRWLSPAADPAPDPAPPRSASSSRAMLAALPSAAAAAASAAAHAASARTAAACADRGCSLSVDPCAGVSPLRTVHCYSSTPCEMHHMNAVHCNQGVPRQGNGELKACAGCHARRAHVKCSREA